MHVTTDSEGGWRGIWRERGRRWKSSSFEGVNSFLIWNNTSVFMDKCSYWKPLDGYGFAISKKGKSVLPDRKEKPKYLRVTIRIWDTVCFGDSGGTVVKVLGYKSEGRWFDSRRCHWNFLLTQSFRSHYGPGVDSASNRNEYQDNFLGVKAVGACGWQLYHLPVPLSWNLGTLTSWNPLGHSRPVTGLIYLLLYCMFWYRSQPAFGCDPDWL